MIYLVKKKNNMDLKCYEKLCCYLINLVMLLCDWFEMRCYGMKKFEIDKKIKKDEIKLINFFIFMV